MALFAEMEQNVSALSQNVYFSFHVNNSMLECLLGSINFSQRLTFPQPTVPSRLIVKQDLDLPGLYLRQEPSVENSWYVSRMMVFSVSIVVRQSKSQDEREIGKRSAPLWNALSKIKSYKNSSLKVILKVLSLCPLSISSTSPEHLRSQKRGWKTCVQTCTTGTRPNFRYHCSSCV